MNLFEKSRQRLSALMTLLSALKYYHIDRVSMQASLVDMQASIADMHMQNNAAVAQYNTVLTKLAAQQHINTKMLDQLIQSAARNVATMGDHRQISAYELRTENELSKRKLRIGWFDNLANGGYVAARSLRRLGYDVDVIIQENWADIYPMARPQWEECEIENIDPLSFKAEDYSWTAPDYVKYRPYSYEIGNRYLGRIEAADEVATLYKETFGKSLSPDLALLLAQNMAHWDYIKAMNDYDVVMLSMTAIILAPFSPKPFVLCPLGSDVYMRAFDEDMGGLLSRAGFRQAAHLSVCETDYFAYIDRMGATGPRSFMPLLVDTDIYTPGDEPELRAEWKAQVGGEHFLLGVCRQSFEWKGSDKLIRAFARFSADQDNKAAKDWRLVLQSWGTDLERSRAMVTELGLDDVTLWQNMCSKPLLRRRQRAADVVADQFVMEGYGASVLESMAAGKPVIMRPVPEASKHHFRTAPPPLIGATTEDEIVAAIQSMADDEQRKAAGIASRAWIEAEHGYKNLGPLYMKMFEEAAGYPGASI